ncbi:LysR family transcriptional regulator [Ideonella sp. A 288]|uniref:LysR family transcriptional regulator n=1 Tax=Ideonella sp. A 288 TaxID=1962181 RepID=UPI0018FE99B0|nr:LysR family transcriptional regulator [Ideonella sp. A 288]
MIDKSGQRVLGSAPARLRLSLRQLEVFAAIARSGSTREAAGRVARSQSAASAALAELEAALGVQLFDRVGRRLVLNENGRALLPGASALLDHAAELQGLFSGEHPAPLRVAASLTVGECLLPPLVAAWQRAHPQGTVRMAIGNTSEVIASVVGLEADVGFIEGPQTHPDLIVRPWVSDELVIVAAPDHPLAVGPAGSRVGVRQLAAAAWILREPGSGTRQAADRWLIEHLGSLHVAFEMGSTEAIKRLAAAGAGLACLSRHAVVEALADGSLLELRTRLPVARRRLAMVVRRDKRLGRATEDFIGHCVAMAPAAG